MEFSSHFSTFQCDRSWNQWRVATVFVGRLPTRVFFEECLFTHSLSLVWLWPVLHSRIRINQWNFVILQNALPWNENQSAAWICLHCFTLHGCVSHEQLKQCPTLQRAWASPTSVELPGSCHKRQKPQAPIRNRQTRKGANAKGLNRNSNLT